MLRVTASHGTLGKNGRDERWRRRRAIFIHSGALLHETIRNNREGINHRAVSLRRWMDRADRINSNARAPFVSISQPSPLSIDAPGRRGGTVYFPFFFRGPRRRYSTIVFLLPRAGKASQGFRIEFRARYRRRIFLCPATSPRKTMGLGRNNIDPLIFGEEFIKRESTHGQKKLGTRTTGE